MKNVKINISGQGVALVDFDVSWCAPCRIQEIIIASLARRFSGRAAILILDLDHNSQLAGIKQIKNVPTLILFKERKEVTRFIGLQSEETLSRAIEDALR
jgi:thioredoxin 1